MAITFSDFFSSLFISFLSWFMQYNIKRKMLRLLCEHIHARFCLKKIMETTEKEIPDKELKSSLEPEDHIGRYGVDDYIDFHYSHETIEQRLKRRNHLMSFLCLRAQQLLFLKKKAGDNSSTIQKSR